MSRISDAFSDGTAFIGFVTGGDPSFNASQDFILTLANSGARIVEIGIPFSDPIAEGTVIQDANLRALAAGATTDDIFDLVASVRAESDVALVLLTYLNPVLHYGYQEFFSRAAQVGVDGIIIPDLPFEEHGELRDITRAAGIDLISMIAPTSSERIASVCEQAYGFIYLVSSMGVTGVRSEIQTDLAGMVAAVRAHTDLPVAIGFGISTSEQASDIAQYADGVIVGSAIVRIIAEHGENASGYLAEYAGSMVSAIM